MYKRLVRMMIRRSIDQLNNGEIEPLLRLAAPDAVLCFPGNNSWATQFRPVRKGRTATATHRGRTELEHFGRQFVAAGLRIDVEDILVNGPPWRTRIWVRGVDSAVDETGAVAYENRIVVCIEARWGIIHHWEDYLDTERVSDWDARIARMPTDGSRHATAPGSPPAAVR